LTRLTHVARWFGAILIALATLATISTGVGAATSATLDARLGGSNASFQTAFGTPDKAKSGNGIEVYTVKGFGLVAAAFPNSNASQITIAADRLAHTPLTTPDAADWTVTVAARYADTLVPTDATYSKPNTTTKVITIVAHSKTLESAFTASSFTKLNVTGKPGDFSVVYNLDTAGNVYSVDMSVGAGAGAVKPTATATVKATSSSNKTPTAAANSANGAGAGTAVHCKDFQTKAEAQAYFDAHGGDSGPTVSTMDGDKDGKACENLP